MNRSIYSRRKAAIPSIKAGHKPHKLPAYFLRSLPVPMCVLDRLSGVYLEANQAYAELLGLKRESILHKSGADLTAGLGEGDLRQIFSRLEEETSLGKLDIIIFQSGGRVIKTGAQAQFVDFEGHEAVLITFEPSTDHGSKRGVEVVENRVEAVNSLSRNLAEADSCEEIVRHLAAATLQQIPDSSIVVISLYDATSLYFTASYNQHAGESLRRSDMPDLHLDLASRGLQSDAIRTCKAVVANANDDRLRSTVTRMGLFTPGKVIQSAICTPMIANGMVIGVLQVFSFKPNLFVEPEAALISLIGNTAANAIQSSRLTINLERTNQDLSQTFEATIDGWSRALELRDFSTERHTERVVSMTMELGRKIGLAEPDLVRIKRGAQLHDIGKMGVPDSILLKPGPLDESEWRVMRKHPVYAYELLRPIPKFNDILDIPYCHHEKWDGSGYPRRLRGSEIPLNARLFAVVDVWDALSSNRPYRTAWPQRQVLDYIQRQSNKHFEPDITSAFLDIVKGRSFTQRTPVSMFRRPLADGFSQLN
jgi:HD-GYP domain-containing protein (c-di-GMP phosphodiesterase class II)